jgi:hypothetical protein
MNLSSLKNFAVAALMASVVLAGGTSFAGSWQQNHPRRAEVNGRLGNQNSRIRNGVRDDQLTRGQAHQLHAEDRDIRDQERLYARDHDGHISKGEDRLLNQQENSVSKQIYDERH